MTEIQAKKAATPQPASPALPPVAKIRRSRGWLSFAWIAPIAALVLTGILGYQAYQQKGIAITISFPEAHGIAPDDAIMYRGVRVGTVRDVHLSSDMERVVVSAEIRRNAQAVARNGTLFWIVRPQVSMREVSGLDTLLGSRYIALEPSKDAAEAHAVFEGLAAAPAIELASNGALSITLKARDRGSIVPGSTVSYRGMTVGHIRDIELAPDATGVLITAEVDESYASLVHENTRFWKPSAIEVDAGFFRGISFQFDSLSSIVGSGVAFATPSERRMGEAAINGQVFELAEEVNEDWLDWDPVIALTPQDGR